MKNIAFAASAAVALACADACAGSWGVAPDGSAWNGRARRFQFAPCLAFEPVPGAVSYEFEVIDDFHDVTNLVSKTPSVDLALQFHGL